LKKIDLARLGVGRRVISKVAAERKRAIEGSLRHRGLESVQAPRLCRGVLPAGIKRVWMTQITTFSNPAGGIAFADPAIDLPIASRAPADCGAPTGRPAAAAVPDTVRMAFAPAVDAASAERYTNHLAHSHYENFSVVSLLLPRRLRQDFCNVYAFCRTADDLADEVGDKAKSLNYLRAFREQARAMYTGAPKAAIFIALARTVRRHDIPVTPFLDLIDAFEQDQRVSRYETFEDVVDYCQRSADPVGRLVLYMCGHRDAERQRLSDKTCTALQLANFWHEHQIRDGISQGRCTESFRDLIRFEVERTEAMFSEGEKLVSMLAPSVCGQVGLFADGGIAILQAIRQQGFDTLARRPVLSRWQKGRLVLSALAAALANFCDLGAFVPRGNSSASRGNGRPEGIRE
jgi:phytoene/squalene synthetase